MENSSFDIKKTNNHTKKITKTKPHHIQNIKYLLKTMYISDQISIMKVRSQKPHSVGQPTQIPKEKTFIEK
jgi:hypothetical protein